MDYLAQLTSLARTFDKELKEISSRLVGIQESIHNLVEAKAKTKDAENKHYETQETPTILRAQFNVPPSERYKEETDTTRQIFNDRLMLYVEIFALLAVIGYTTVAAFQLEEMRKATKASSEASQTAAAALDENKRQFGLMLSQIRSQTSAQIQSGSAAKQVAGIAQNTLHISERAYIVFGSPQLNPDTPMFDIPIINSGHMPSGAIDATTYEVTFNSDTLTSAQVSFEKNMVEHHRSILHVNSVSAGSPDHLAIPVPSLARDKLNNGTQMIMIIGTIDYNDGFPDSPAQHSQLCMTTSYHLVAKQWYPAICDPAIQLPKFKSLDWTAYTDESRQ